MTDYIKRKEAAEILQSKAARDVIGFYGIAWIEARLREIPAADVVEVRHGHCGAKMDGRRKED